MERGDLAGWIGAAWENITCEGVKSENVVKMSINCPSPISIQKHNIAWGYSSQTWWWNYVWHYHEVIDVKVDVVRFMVSLK